MEDYRVNKQYERPADEGPSKPHPSEAQAAYIVAKETRRFEGPTGYPYWK